MKKNIPSYVKIPLILIVAIILIEWFVDSKNGQYVFTEPIILVFLGLLLLVLIAVETALNKLNQIEYNLLSEKEKAQVDNAEDWSTKVYHKLTGAKPIEEEGQIALSHEYDGIHELDNSLPPWWKYGFIVTIISAGVYLVKYEVLGEDNQKQEYEKSIATAKISIEQYKKTAKNLVDFKTVTLLTDAKDINAGKKIFETNCVACHMKDGAGGIGPNLTDKYWILGGGIKNVFKTISGGGRDGKGMIAWKSSLKPVQIAQTASYVLSLQGTKPANPKEAQGEIWNEEKTIE